jgi:hypothetical protein
MDWVNELHPYFLIVWCHLTNDQLSDYLKKFTQNNFKFSDFQMTIVLQVKELLNIIKGLETFKHIVDPIAWREKIIRLWCSLMQPLMKVWCHGSLPTIAS